MNIRTFLALPLLVACGKDDGTETGNTSTSCTEKPWLGDADGDGYGDDDAVTFACDAPNGAVLEGGDCDDSDADINPAATEVCDAHDNDCDGVEDESDAEDAVTWYPDWDEDGYGDQTQSNVSCFEPSGWVDVGGDCDDADHEINPGAEEICDNGIDDDCDGALDTDDSDAGTNRYYEDGDGDGYGLPTSWADACDAPTGFVDNFDDCDDEDASISPGADEICNDLIDNNCNDEVDEESAPDPVRWWVDEDGDNYGDPDSAVTWACSAPSFDHADNDEDCDDTDWLVHPGAAETWYDGVDSDCSGGSDYDADGDGEDSADYEGDDCDDGEATVYTAAAEVCGDGIDNDCDDLVDPCDEDARLLGSSDDDGAGTAVSAAGDWDGDGLDDVLVGAPGFDAGRTSQGIAYVLAGDATGDLDLDSSAYARLIGVADDDMAGAGLTVMPPSTDWDTFAAAVGAPGESGDVGAVYVVLGPVSGDLSLSRADATLTGEAAGDAVGSALASTGMLSASDEVSLIIGSATHAPYGRRDAGAAYILTAPIASLNLSYSDSKLVGEGDEDLAGTSVAAGGDVDGDGTDDFLVGAPGVDLASNEGVAYLVLDLSTTVLELGDSDVRFEGQFANDAFGTAVAVVGDTNSDGYDDIAVGAPGSDVAGSESGAVYLFLGSTVLGHNIPARDADAVLTGHASDDGLGSAVAAAGDLDRNGYDDMLVGAPGSDFGGTDGGSAYLWFTPLFGSYEVGDTDGQVAGAAGDAAGSALARVGDYDGDGNDDAVVGLPFADDGGSDAGMGIIVLGGAW